MKGTAGKKLPIAAQGEHEAGVGGAGVFKSADGVHLSGSPEMEGRRAFVR